MSYLQSVSFRTTLVAVPIWLGLLTLGANEINEAGVVAYGLLLLFLGPMSAYVTSRRLAPWASWMLRPVAPPWGGMVLVSLAFAAIALAEFAYWSWVSRGGGSSLGVMSWYLILTLAPPMYCGCIAHLAAATMSRTHDAG